jgi:hypothetical protein
MLSAETPLLLTQAPDFEDPLGIRQRRPILTVGRVGLAQ